MHMNKINWEEGLDMASLVESGALKRAPIDIKLRRRG